LKKSHHCGEKPLPCIKEVCKETFKRLDDLRKHIKRRHVEGKELEESCGANKKRKLSDSPYSEVKLGRSDALQEFNNQTGGIHLQSLAGKEAIEPFINLVNSLPQVTQVKSGVAQIDGLDGTAPIHWITEDHIPDKRTASAQVLTDIESGQYTTFASGRLVNPLRTDNRISDIAKVMSHMIDPDPDSPELVYAANIMGKSTAPLFHVPSHLHKLRHFDEDEVTRRYSSNVTPQGTVVDLHQGKMSEALGPNTSN
jgi:hypothetical protein